MGTHLWTSIFAIGVALAAGSLSTSREKLIEESDAYYQSQFADLTLTKEGVFGTSRVERSDIKNHLRQGGDPSYSNREWHNSVSIYGNRGRKLDPATLENRYHRSSNGTPAGKINPPRPKEWPKDWLAKAAKQFLGGNLKPYVVQSGAYHLEARPIVLSKPECVSCHTGLRKGAPVAILVYTVAPFLDAEPPPPR